MSTTHAARQAVDQPDQNTAAALTKGPVQNKTANNGNPTTGMRSGRRNAIGAGSKIPTAYVESWPMPQRRQNMLSVVTFLARLRAHARKTVQRESAFAEVICQKFR